MQQAQQQQDLGFAPVAIPPELRGVPTSALQSYVSAKVRQFAGPFARRLNVQLSPQQVDAVAVEMLNTLAAQDTPMNRSLRLVLRHDCQSTGCGETGCLLCQFNPSRLCRRNLKQKYLIDDHLKAKCGAPLRVELVDETAACVHEGLPAGVQLEISVLNGEKYKEICPDNTLLSHAQLRSCVISHHTKALLRRDGMSDDQLRCFLQLERGQAGLSDLSVTTSSEALLAGKAPTFRLLVWALNALGEPVPNVTYVVSESFVVATKRVKHAIKSDIPSVADSVSKLIHIGKATVDKLTDLRGAAKEEGFDIQIPDDLNRIERVGQFQQLVELSEMNTDLKNKVRHLLKLSPEKWEEVCSHAQSAVMPDFRPRVWWCPAVKLGLLFACKNGSVVMDQPTALVKMAQKGEDEKVVDIAQLDPGLFNAVPKLKQQAVTSWYATNHPGWAIYWKEGQEGGGAGAGPSMQVNAALDTAALLPPVAPLSAMPVPQAAAAAPSARGGRLPTPPPLGGGGAAPSASQGRTMTPFAFSALPVAPGPSAADAALAQAMVAALGAGAAQQAAGPAGPAAPGASGGAAAPSTKSPFAYSMAQMAQAAEGLPPWMLNAAAGAAAAGGVSMAQQGGNAAAAAAAAMAALNGAAADPPGAPVTAGHVNGAPAIPGMPQLTDDLPSIGLMNTLPTMDRGLSLFNSMLGADGPSSQWTAPGLMGASALGGSGSLNGSLNHTLNALLQDSLTPGLEPPTKLARLGEDANVGAAAAAAGLRASGLDPGGALQ